MNNNTIIIPLLLLVSACAPQAVPTDYHCQGYGQRWSFNRADASVNADKSVSLKDGRNIPYGKGIVCTDGRK